MIRGQQPGSDSELIFVRKHNVFVIIHKEIK